jgi:hypothetical protein
MKLLITLLLLRGFSLAQSKVDFSGIFLRTQSSFRGNLQTVVPRILEIQQMADEVVVTATQNGETAVAHYRFGKKSQALQARLKDGSLILRGIVRRQESRGLFLPGFVVTINVEEKWELSPDSQQLVIHTRKNLGFGDSNVDTRYTRQPSLEAAQAAAAQASKADCGTALPVSALLSQMKTTPGYDQGVPVGIATLERITRCVSYDAVLSGNFFNGLERTEKSGQEQFHKKNQTVTAYTGDLVLEVGLLHGYCTDEIGDWVPTGPALEAAQDLRFKVRWLGDQQKDLGEIPSDFLVEPWREWTEPEAFYRMTIPADGIPLGDDLEVLILSKSGEQLACVKRHI